MHTNTLTKIPFNESNSIQEGLNYISLLLLLLNIDIFKEKIK